jgi:hypothetical protein
MNPSLDPVGEIDAAFASFERDHPDTFIVIPDR